MFSPLKKLCRNDIFDGVTILPATASLAGAKCNILLRKMALAGSRIFIKISHYELECERKCPSLWTDES